MPFLQTPYFSQVEEYTEALEEIMLKREDGIRIMPELYAVPGDKASIYLQVVISI